MSSPAFIKLLNAVAAEMLKCDTLGIRERGRSVSGVRRTLGVRL